jgi:hypothetical protein
MHGCTIVIVITLIYYALCEYAPAVAVFSIIKKIKIRNFCRPTIADGSYDKNCHRRGWADRSFSVSYSDMAQFQCSNRPNLTRHYSDHA